MKLIGLGVACILIGLGSVAQRGRAGSVEVDPPFVPNELIVCFKPDAHAWANGPLQVHVPGLLSLLVDQLDGGTGIERIERLTPDLPEPSAEAIARAPTLERPMAPRSPEDTAAIFHRFGLDRTCVLHFARPIDPVGLSRELMERYTDLIEYAEPNYLLSLSREPNDPRFRTQWHLVNRASGLSGKGDVRAAQAWDITVGSSDVIIAVIDSGIDFSHPDFEGKVIPGRDFFQRDATPQDDNGHGTAVAGVAAANTDNSLSVAGVSWLSRLLIYRVSGPTGGAPVSSVASAISAAISMAPEGVRVINLSLGLCDDTAPISQRNAIAAAGAANITVVVSAGNGCDNDGRGTNNDERPHWPANHAADFTHVISVAATTRVDLLTSFSNFGAKTVTVAAPGEGIVTTVPTDPGLDISNGSGVASVSGTSFAAPLVAGVAALIYSQFPSIKRRDVRDRLLGCVERGPLLAGKTQSGGRINAARALETDEVPPAPISDLQWTAGNSRPALIWTATGDDDERGQAMFYEIRYSNQPLTPSTFFLGTRLNTSIFPKPAGEFERLPLEGLPPGALYFMIRSIDNVGNSSFSNSTSAPLG